MADDLAPLFYTKAEALRAALTSTIVCSAQELQEAVGQVVVATAAELPASIVVGPDARSAYDPATRTLVLLADRIPVGQEGQAMAEEIERHHGRHAVQAALGDCAAQLLGIDGEQSKYVDHGLRDAYGHGQCASLAMAVLENMNLPCVVFYRTDPSDDSAAHVANAVDGGFLDIYGIVTHADLEKRVDADRKLSHFLV